MHRAVLMSCVVVLSAPIASGVLARDATPPQTAEAAKKYIVAGWVENGWIGEPGVKVRVKLDTGAKTSSIHAAQFRDYTKDGVRRVSFTLTNNDGAELKIDQPVLRTVTIRRAGVEKKDRPVISLKICLAGVTTEAEFTMADRSELTYPVLVGRNVLAGKILVDSGRTYLADGLCAPK